MRRLRYAAHSERAHGQQPKMTPLGDDIDVGEPSAALEESAPTPRQDELLLGEENLFGEISLVSRQPDEPMQDTA